MKGIVFNLLQEIVVDHYGEDVWDQLLDKAELDGVYTSVGSYPDEDLGRLVVSASGMLGLPASDVVRWVGRESLPRLASRFPQFFTPYTRTRDFVLTLNDIIHPEVRKLYPGANAPDFEFDTSSPEALIMLYRSERKLCEFACGLIEGAAAHFGEEARIDQPVCMNHGQPHCRMEIRFMPAAG